ncbi:DNA polymerase kappa-like, partial [Saccoglossus kowalevskii]|uniref:DNA polymerase kappa-like n=1 Tax=Saccoglossus kowalevskii TaxID=10224 RepID=A0ABM0M7V8_SACKO
GKTITLKIKLVTFETKTRAVTVSCVTNTLSDIYNAAKELLRVEIQTMQPEPLRLRLMGVRMSSFISNNAVGKQGSIKHFLKTQNSRNPELSISSSSNNSIYVINAVIPTQSESHGLKEDGIITGSITSQLVMKEMFVKPNLHTKLEHVETIHASTSSVSFNEYSQMKETKVTVDREDDYKHTNEDLLQTIVECNSPAGVYYPHDKTPCVNKETLTCPVCNSEQKSSDLFVFNSHVDMCLNKKAIQNMLQNDEAVSPKLNSSKCYSPNKRPLQSSSQSSSKKKRKTVNMMSSNTPTLDRFFSSS